jgi:SnoaL-like domain
MTDREDRQDISDLLVRYATGIDRRDWPLFRTVFTGDCELDYGQIGNCRGIDAVTEFMEQAHATAGHTMHRMSNQVITVEGDKAVARRTASCRCNCAITSRRQWSREAAAESSFSVRARDSSADQTS